MSAGLDGMLREWTLEKPFKVEQRCADVGAPSIVQLSPNGQWLLLTGTGGRAQLCDLNDPKLTFVRLADSAVAHAAFSSDGNRMVLARGNGDIDLWDVSQQPKRIKPISGNGPLNDIGFSPDGQSLATANIDGSARVFSLADSGPSLALEHGGGLERALFNRDGTKIYTAGGQRPPCLWDIPSRKLLCEIHGHGPLEIGDCRLSPDGRLILAVPRRGEPAIICDASTGAPLRQLQFSPISAAFSADGTRLVTTDSQNMARVWDVTAEEFARPVPLKGVWPPDKPVPATAPHRSAASCCAIRADASLIATGSDDTTARVWDAETGEAVSPPLKHTDRVIFVGFREGGNQLVTVSADAVIRLWTLDDGTPTERLIHLARATSGQKIEDGAAVALKPAQIEEEWNAARAVTSPDSQ
jgi:WD40 repeat protein